MRKSILLIITLTLTSLQLFSNQTSKKEVKNTDSLECLDLEEMHIVNGAFIDLDDCERDVILLSKKVQVLDTLLKSKVELQDGFKKQEKLNQELKKELKESIILQNQRFDILESAYKQQSKQQKKRSIITGTSIGGVVLVTFGVVIFKILK